MRTRPYHPKADEQVEWFNRTLGTMLTEQDPKDWDLHLPFLTAAYWATAHSATGINPNFMMFRREITLPVDVMYGIPPGESEEASEC